MSASHTFPSRDGVGVVRANFAKTAAQIEDEQRQRAQTQRVTAEWQAEAERRSIDDKARRAAAVAMRRQFDEGEDIAILAMRKHKMTHSEIARVLGRHESSIQMRLKLLTNPAMRPAVEGPFSSAEDKIIVKMRGLGESRKAIAAELGRSCAAVKSRIAHLTAPRQRKAEFQRPDVAAKQTATTIERRCLNCQKRFDAPTRFIRLCETHRRGDVG